jgi:hypothetical protein
VTDEDEAALSGYLTDPTAEVLIWGDAEDRGFAIFCDLGDPSATVCLMRLALCDPGRGEGRAFLSALVDHGFGPLGWTAAARTCGPSVPTNARASGWRGGSASTNMCRGWTG